MERKKRLEEIKEKENDEMAARLKIFESYERQESLERM